MGKLRAKVISLVCRPFVSFTDPVACSLAVVGAQYRSRLAAVLSMLDQLTDQTDRVPLAVFLLSEDEGEVMEYNNSTLRHPLSPLLVSSDPYFHKETDIPS